MSDDDGFDPDIPWWGTYLRRTLRYFALPAKTQWALFDDYPVSLPVELWIDFGSARHVMEDLAEAVLTDAQRASLDALEAQLQILWDSDDARLLTNEALWTCPEWDRTRHLANEALQTFGWSLEVPPEHLVDRVTGDPILLNEEGFAAWRARYEALQARNHRFRLSRLFSRRSGSRR